ncbi:putative G-protein coupled receptor CG31760 [Cochliomyia hominivorax]
MMAELNELTDSTDSTTKTNTTIISPDSTDLEQNIFDDLLLQSPTSSSSMYAIRSPSPPLPAYFKYPTHLKAPAQYHPSDSEEEGVTLTEIVEIHRVPSVALITMDNNNFPVTREGDLDIESQVNNNNTSCSLSSTLTDSKTLDVRTPIVV